ncbi:hypothetical protein [Kinneretia aquatilis]|uniref:hypothetical protein n=1 Tax=Kinneretia aquatilis TaxID=2070761 RepID=UPI0014951046|nr:hypothetical protein [Paucibacter aquatile]WIV96018.1 hypothetical protein K9V56_013260 [Paucibacter aquatile]
MRTSRTSAFVAGLALGLAGLGSAAQASDIGVSVSVGQPGFYGRIDLGSAGPAPRLIYNEPVWVQGRPHHHHRARVRVDPWYLYVPPGHARHWARHCGDYGACGRPVYFVQEGWYREVYGPRRGGEEVWRPGHGRGHGHGHHHGHHHGRPYDR